MSAKSDQAGLKLRGCSAPQCVLEMSGIDADVILVLFGQTLHCAMLRYGINDIRLHRVGDVRFSEQFK